MGKGDTLDMFKIFVTEIKDQLNRNIKRSHSDDDWSTLSHNSEINNDYIETNGYSSIHYES